MNAARLLNLVCTLMALTLGACSGSGSSGFDGGPAAESAAITQALDEQRCVDFQGLLICPSDSPVAAAPTATPPRAPTATPELPQATVTPAATRTAAPPTATPVVTAAATSIPTYTPTATRMPTPAMMRLVIEEATDAQVACERTDAQTCVVRVQFLAEGFPLSAEFRVAVRTLNPDSRWMIGPPLRVDAAPGALDARAPLDAGALAPGTGATSAQIAVLVFLTPSEGVPAEVELLLDSGADFAYVTSSVTIQPDS